jgi:FkbM family methyltransferase
MIQGIRKRLARREPRPSAGQRILEALATTGESTYFIEIGAGDGVFEDHVWPFARDRAWRGIAVEPIPYVFRRLSANYEGVDGVELVNAAISDRDGELTLYYVAEVESSDAHHAEMPEHYHLLASTSRELLLKQTTIPDLEDRIVEIRVPALTPDSLLRRHGVDQVDVLVIDAEGLDCRILGSFDIDRLRPRVIAFEDINVDAAEARACCERLERLGYSLLQEGLDTWAVDVQPEDQITTRWTEIRAGGPAVSRADLERWFANATDRASG